MMLSVEQTAAYRPGGFDDLAAEAVPRALAPALKDEAAKLRLGEGRFTAPLATLVEKFAAGRASRC